MLWQCPQCPAGITHATGVHPDAILAARLRHRQVHHPCAGRRSFLLPAARLNTLKATASKRAAARAQFILKRKMGALGDHTQEIHVVPIAMAKQNRGTKGSSSRGRRLTRPIHLCTACGRTADSAQLLARAPCAAEGHRSHHGRAALRANLRALLDEPHPEDRLAATRALLEKLEQPAAPLSVGTHSLVATAWPAWSRKPRCARSVQYTVRYVCTTCYKVNSKYKWALRGECRPQAWTHHGDPRLEELFQMATDPHERSTTQGRTAALILDLVGQTAALQARRAAGAQPGQ